MTQAPIVRDPTDACSFDNRGQLVWAYLPPPPPPPLRRTNHIRRIAILAAVAMLLAMLALVAVALTADAASDGPVRGQRYRVCKMVAIDPPTWRCRLVVVR